MKRLGKFKIISFKIKLKKILKVYEEFKKKIKLFIKIYDDIFKIKII